MINSMIRPAWTPVTIAMMIVGFMIAWPLGLAVIAYIIWGDRLEAFKSDVNVATDKAAGFFGNAKGGFNMGNGKFGGGFGQTFGQTGNVAFDEWREGELKRIEAERAKLAEARHEFDNYLRELRRAKDEEEFRLFMAERNKQVDAEGGKSVTA